MFYSCTKIKEHYAISKELNEKMASCVGKRVKTSNQEEDVVIENHFLYVANQKWRWNGESDNNGGEVIQNSGEMHEKWNV